MIRSMVALVLICSISTADTATQTEWTWPGNPGVINSWGDEFDIDSGICWYTWVGDATMETIFPVHSIPTGVGAIHGMNTADFDGDFDVDVLCYYPSSLFWIENVDGLGTDWVQHTVSGTYAGYSACPSDPDQDGDMDIVACRYSVGQVSWFENSDGQGTSWEEHLVGGSLSEADAVSSADIDGDGLPDVVASGGYGEGLKWYRNVGNGSTWIEHAIDSFIEDRIEIGDIDSDGDNDLFCANSLQPRWFENLDGAGTSWAEHDFEEDNIHDCAIADADGDGDLDLFLGGSYIFGWYENQESKFTEFHSVCPSDHIESIMLGDLDGDGDTDALAGSEFYNTHLKVYENTGNGYSWVTRGADANFCLSVDAADIDGDGSLDFIASCYGGLVFWWEQDPCDPGYALLQSSILYLGSDPGWTTVDWSADVPPGTSLWLQVRASDDPADMGDWSDELYSPCSLSGILSDSANFLQYRVHFDTDDPWVTPVLHDVTFSWNPLWIEGDEAPSLVELNVPSNPSAGSPSIEFGLPSGMEVSLAVHDLAGRVVASTAPTYCSTGWHSENLGELPPGVYFVRLTAGETSFVERFAVIE